MAPAPLDVVIVGAGAAGIAAARRLRSRASFVIVEANDHVGGRCVTDTQTFGVPFDRGAHWLHMPDENPLVKLAPSVGFRTYAAPDDLVIRIGSRNATPDEVETFETALCKATLAFDDVGRGGDDISCAEALPSDIGDWRWAVEFMLGPFSCSKELADVSATDFARSIEEDDDVFCCAGFGTLLAELAVGLPICLSTPVHAIKTSGSPGVKVETSRGTISARAAIVTVSTGVLAAEKIRFEPECKHHLEAASVLKPGSYDHIVLELPGNPLGLGHDHLVLEKSTNTRTAALLANISGTELCQLDVGGRFGRDLCAQGANAMVAFAQDWLAGLFGHDLRKVFKRTATTRWDVDPWTLGAFSAADPDCQSARRVLMEPLDERVWFAGEATSERLWATVGGAWEAGEQAAEAAMGRLGLSGTPQR